MGKELLEKIGTDMGKLVAEKNAAYGNSFGRAGDLLVLLYPDGVKPEQYRDMLAIIRVIDKLFRIATRKDAFGESPWKDITGYGILSVWKDIEETEAHSRRVETEAHGSGLARKVFKQPK